MAVKNDGSHLRSQEDNERLARQKAKNPTNVQRAKQLAKEYSNPYKFSNTVTVKKTVTNNKWYSGDKPTARETYARMFTVADGDQKKFEELEAQYAEESKQKGSPIYNPYADATNSKAIEGLEALGFDMSGGVTSKWLNDNMDLLNYGRQTTTSYGPSAPTKSSTAQQDAAYWFNTLLKAEERTQAAENEYKALADEVAYWAERGYSDEEIVKRVRSDFGSKYSTLQTMDDDRLMGDATLLNRKVNYSGDDTLYGMIWAARNGGGTGDYFADSVKHALGQGSLYKADPNSEAARDPSNYEGYSPYSLGSTLHDSNIKHGQKEFTREWLEENRDMLDSEDGRKEWTRIEEAITATEKARDELTALDQWIQKKLERGKSAEEIKDSLAAMLDKDGEGYDSNYKTLANMEYYRERGSYIELAGAVDFTLPGHFSKIDAMVHERDTAAVAEESTDGGFGEWLSEAGRTVKRWFTKSIGENADPLIDAQHDNYKTEDIAKAYVRELYGVELGALTDEEKAKVNETIGKVNKAYNAGSTGEDDVAANHAADELAAMFAEIVADPTRLIVEEAEPPTTYQSSIAYRSVFGSDDAESREGMVEGVFSPMAAMANTAEVLPEGRADKDSPEAAAYEAMLQGGQWDGVAYTWALRNSANRAGLETELIEGIKAIMRGEAGAKEKYGLANSWYQQHASLISDTSTHFSLLGSATSEQWDSRRVYGERIFQAIEANSAAKKNGAITPDQYIENLIVIGDVADIVAGVTDGNMDEADIEEVFSTYPQQGEKLAHVVEDCSNAVQGMIADEEAKKTQIAETVRNAFSAYHAGTADSYAEAIVDAAFATDVTEVAKEDATYQASLAYLDENLNFDVLMQRGMVFTTGSMETDMMMDHATIQQSGAQAYINGVSGIAKAKLEQDMQAASACGMTLAEYYEAFPEQGKSGEQLLMQAESDYRSVWSEFGNSISAMLQANESLEEENENSDSEEVSPEDSLTVHQAAELGIAAFNEGFDQNVAKLINMVLYAGHTDEEAVNLLRRKYGNDAEALRSDYQSYAESLPEGSEQRAELEAKMNTFTDLFEIGMSVPQMKNEHAIEGANMNLQAIQEAVNQYGTKADKTVMDIVQNIATSTTDMAFALMGQAGGLSSFFSQLLAAVPQAGASAYDITKETGSYELGVVSGFAHAIVTGATEAFMDFEYADSLTRSRMMLARKGATKMGKQAPGALAELAERILVKGSEMLGDAGGEGLQEMIQETLGILIDNTARNSAGVGSGTLLTDDDLQQIGQAGIVGAAMSPILGAMVKAGQSSYTGAIDTPFVDVAGDIISAAEAALQPDYEGIIINEAVDTETNLRAMQDAAAELDAIMASNEAAAVQQAQAELETARAAESEAMNKYQQIQAEADAVSAELAALNEEMLNSDAFTEDQREQMLALADRMLDFPGAIADAEAFLQGQQQAREAAQEKYAVASQVIQAQYDRIMEAARARVRQQVVDRLFSGSSEAARAAEEAYLAKVAELTTAKNELRSAKADLDMYGRGSVRGRASQGAYAIALNEVEKLTEEVAQLKLDVETAYAQTPEGLAEEALELGQGEAEAAALAAAEAAAAAPDDAQSQELAAVTAAELEAETSRNRLDSALKEIGKKLKSADAGIRGAASRLYSELTHAAAEAEASAKQARKDYDRTYSPQGRLQTALEAFRKFSNADLMDEDSPLYETAQKAYAALQVAMQNAEYAAAQEAASNAAENMDAENLESVRAYMDAKEKADSITEAAPADETEMVKHIDDRSDGDARDRKVQPFFNSNRETFAEYAKAMAETILDDAKQSIPGKKILIWGERGEGMIGSQPLVTGQKRVTSDLIANYKDYYKWRWEDVKQFLEKFIGHLESGTPIPNTANMKRVEMMVNEALSEGYAGIDGTYIQPAYDYIQSKSQIDGRTYAEREVPDGESFYDVYGIGSPVTPQLIQAVKDASAAVSEGQRRTPDGSYILEIGNKFVYTDGNKDGPQIKRVITFLDKGVNPDIDAVLREVLYDIEEIGEPEEIERVREENLATVSDLLETGNSFRTYDIGNDTAGSGGPGGSAGSTGRSDGTGTGNKVSFKRNASNLTTADDGWADHRTPARTGEQTRADRNPIEILSDLTRSIRVGYNPGGSMNVGNARVRRDVMAFYNEHARSITSRTNEAGDLATGLHEFGHAVQARLPALHATQQMITNLPPAVQNAYDPIDLDGEAVAEFVVDYMYSRENAVNIYGDMYVQQFEDALRSDQVLRRAIMDARIQVELWNNAGTSSKLGATIKEGDDPRRGQIGSWIQRLARNVETSVADLTAPADLVGRDFRRRALYSMHASQRADTSLTRFMIDPQGRNIGQSLAERFYRAGVGERDQNEVSRYALARHALDRLAQNKPVFDEHEFPEQELRDYVTDIETNRPNVAAGADALVSFWNDYMDAWWVDTGMIDRADVDRMRQMYPHYVPTFRVVGKNFNQYGGRSSRFQMRRAVDGGSSLEVIDPVASIVKMTQQMTNTVTQNQLMQAFHNEMQQGGLGDIAERVMQDMVVQRNDTDRLQASLDAINATGTVDPVLMDDAYAEMLNLQERWYGSGQNYGANVVGGVDEYGNRFFYRIKDEGLYNLLSGNATRAADMGMLLRGIRNFKNVFTKLTTGSNPLFALKNAQRDIQASVNTGTHSLTYADGMIRWIRALYEVMTGSNTYRDWQAMGGGEHTRFNTELNGSDTGSVVRELGRGLMRGRVDRRGNFRTRGTALGNISNVFTWEKFNNAIENASRYAEYRFGRHDLNTDDGRREAFMASQDVTTNFGTHGANRLIRLASQVVPFMNATIQGLNKDYNILKDLFDRDANVRRQAAPKVAKTALNVGLTAMLQYAMLQAVSGGDDDEDYALLTQEMRMGNLIIPVSKGAMDVLGEEIGFDKPYIRIPIAQGPLARGLYAAALDMVSNMADYSPMEVEMWEAAKSILSDSMPDGTVFQAISDAANNRTWYGGEIESEYMRSYSVTNRYDSDTPAAVVELGRMLNVSPAKLDYLLNQYSGFAGKIIMPVISTDRLNVDDGWNLSGAGKNLAYSILKNYTIDPVSSNDLSSSYAAAKDTISQIVADGKAGKPMGNLAYSADADDAYSAAERLSKEFSAIDKEIKAHWADYNEIKASDLSDGEKASQMRSIRRDYIIPLQQDAMALYEEYKIEFIDADSLAMEIIGRIPWGIERPAM